MQNAKYKVQKESAAVMSEVQEVYRERGTVEREG